MVESADQSAEQIETRNADQRIRTAESRAQEQRDERLRQTITRTRAAREQDIATARVQEPQRQRASRASPRAPFVRLAYAAYIEIVPFQRTTSEKESITQSVLEPAASSSNETPCIGVVDELKSVQSDSETVIPSTSSSQSTSKPLDKALDSDTEVIPIKRQKSIKTSFQEISCYSESGMKTRKLNNCVTVHFNRNEHNGVYELDERHTSQYISQMLLKTCAEWGIKKDNVTAVVTDNAANMVKTVELTFVRRIFSKMTSAGVAGEPVAREVQRLAPQEITKRMGSIEHVTPLAIANILDPSFKKNHFNDAIACSNAVWKIKDLMTPHLRQIEEIKSDSDKSDKSEETFSLWSD
ncbi:unnamed protein product [Parnassius apollo]|uniref:(apollo) hypothetical protein n=1 Tax=Parnassius apollo TaxID=110799 RepID=A0A8S3WDL9_PARAO|nr:unnamed protein product [Parnassius apollo]